MKSSAALVAAALFFSMTGAALAAPRHHARPHSFWVPGAPPPLPPCRTGNYVRDSYCWAYPSATCTFTPTVGFTDCTITPAHDRWTFPRPIALRLEHVS